MKCFITHVNLSKGVRGRDNHAVTALFLRGRYPPMKGQIISNYHRPVKSHPRALVFRQTFREGSSQDSKLRTCRTRYACFGTRISVGRLFKFRQSSEVRNYGVQDSGFTRAFHWCVTVVAEVAASSSKYARLKKMSISVGFCVSFRNTTVRSGLVFVSLLARILNTVVSYRTPDYFCQWQLINYWDDCHLELIPRPSSATEMNFQSVFECENAWSGRAGARNRIRKERFSATKLLSLESLRDCLSVRGRVFKGISDTQQILVEIGCFLLVHHSA